MGLSFIKLNSLDGYLPSCNCLTTRHVHRDLGAGGWIPFPVPVPVSVFERCTYTYIEQGGINALLIIDKSVRANIPRSPLHTSID